MHVVGGRGGRPLQQGRAKDKEYVSAPVRAAKKEKRKEKKDGGWRVAAWRGGGESGPRDWGLCVRAQG